MAAWFFGQSAIAMALIVTKRTFNPDHLLGAGHYFVAPASGVSPIRMENSFLNWLVSYFSIFGFHIQYWMPTMLLIFAAFLLWNLLGPKSEK